MPPSARYYIEDADESRLVRCILAARQAADAAFPPGLHLSTICDDIMKRLYPAKYRGMSDEAAAGYQELGNTIEDVIAAQLRTRYQGDWTKPPSFQYRGVQMSPDGENKRTRTIHEAKATWVCSSKFLILDDQGRATFKSLKFIRYEMQILPYLKATGYRRARLHVWFLNGTCRPPVPHWPLTIRLSYSQQTINEGWRRIDQHRKDMLRAIKAA